MQMQNNINQIKVSIVMPTFNRANMIGMAINSVLKQNYNNWELLIIDNESSDNTKEVVEKFSWESITQAICEKIITIEKNQLNVVTKN